MHVTVLCGHSWFPWEGLSTPFAFRGAAGKLFMKNAGVAEFWELSSSGLFLTQLATTCTISAKNLEGWHLKATAFNVLLHFIE